MRRTGAIAAGILLAGTIAGGISPASADAGVVCAGAAQTITLSDGIYYPIVGPTRTNVTTSFTAIGSSGGTCDVDATLATANCGNSVGSGNVSWGGHDHPFNLITAGGTVFVIGPGAYGVVNATPAVGESCTYDQQNPSNTPGADQFILSGAVALA